MCAKRVKVNESAEIVLVNIDQIMLYYVFPGLFNKKEIFFTE